MSRGYSLVVGCGLLTAGASLVAAPRLYSAGWVVVAHGLSFSGLWDLPGPRIEPVSPASAGRFSST